MTTQVRDTETGFIEVKICAEHSKNALQTFYLTKPETERLNNQLIKVLQVDPVDNRTPNILR